MVGWLIAGTVIFNVSDSDVVKLIRYPKPEPPAFIAVRNGYVYLNATVDLDGNRVRKSLTGETL